MSAKAAYAYDRGIAGKGVTIAILDTGIDTSGREFAGRISPDSTAFDQKIARCGTCAAETISLRSEGCDWSRHKGRWRRRRCPRRQWHSGCGA
ncbi:hypothetical protein ACVOMT_13755 [Sphingomonas panni]